jgi:REP element-mobilizing transposase RayT
LRIHVEGAAHHVLSRGGKGAFIFERDDDKRHFLDIFSTGIERYGIELFAYCIMDNHYHLLLSDPGRNLSRIMHYTGSVFAGHMRRKRGLIGHVFSGRFKSLCVKTEHYLAGLSRYIHLNPYHAGIVERAEEFPWSSYASYLGMKDAPSWLNTDWILRRYGSKRAEASARYRAFIEEGMDNPDEYPIDEAVARAVAGDENFIQKGLGSIERNRRFNNVSYRRLYLRPIPIDTLKEGVCEYYGVRTIKKGCPDSSPDTKRAREMFVWLARQHTPSENREIIEVTGHTDPSAVSHLYRRTGQELESDAAFRSQWEREAAAVISRFSA